MRRDNNFDEEKMIRRKIVKYAVAGTVCVILACSTVAMYTGAFNIFYTKTIEKAQKDADRQVFKESLPYTEQAAQFLAKSYKEYNDTDDEAEKASIKEYVAMKYPNLDMSNIDNSKLRSFYMSCID